MSLIKLMSSETKENFSDEGKEILSVNLKYPVFEGENEEVCSKLSDFYASAAGEYAKYCKNKLAPGILKKAERDKHIEKNGASMNWYVSFLNENILSLITDISYFNGKQKNTSRYVQNWNLNDCSPLHAKNAFLVTRETKELYISEICSKILNGEGGFKYYANAEKIARRHFSFEKYYFTVKGIAFYYDKNLLFETDSVYPAFVMPYSGIEGVTQMYRSR